jgi:hypothetical protein
MKNALESIISNNKFRNAMIFVIFLAVFIIVAGLYNNGSISFLPSADKKNVIDIVFKDKNFVKDYSKEYSRSDTISISDFEENEKWVGDINFENIIFLSGESSISLISRDREEKIISLKKNVDLQKMNTIKFLVYSGKIDNSNNIEGLTVRFGNSDDSRYFEYPILNVKYGWNEIKMSKDQFILNGGPPTEEKAASTGSAKTQGFSWSNISKITISLTARTGTSVELLFDRMWAESNDDYMNDFRALIYDIVSYKSFNGKTYPNFWPMGSVNALIKKITSVKDFTYTAKLIPQVKGLFGIGARVDISTNYGYYLIFNGVDTGTWMLEKIGKIVNKSSVTVLDQGEVNNFAVEKDKPIWLRIKTKGNSISGYFSTDGKNFTQLSDQSDNELKSGGVSIYVPAASVLLESVGFSQ